MADSGDCVALAALLKHPLARFGLTAEEGARLRPGLERLALRGPRRHETCAEIVALCQNDDGALDLAQRLVAAVTPLTDAPATLTLDAFAEALAQCAELVAAETDGGAPQLWVGRAGETAAGVVRDLVEEGAALGAMAKDAAARAFLKVLDGREAAPPGDGDPRCAIWSPLEARLQRRDVMILGGLNEGVWPAPPPEDAFLSRAMRNRLGLPSPDARIGLAAHDFAQLACAPRLVLTRALKQGGAPALASRWLWRLKTLLKGAGLALAPADHALAWARALDAPERMAPLKPPRPAPPAEARLQRISVTEVETLIRDPYAVYARRILGLEVLKPVGYEPGAAERGSAIHKAIEEAGDGADLRALMAALDQALKDYGFGAVRRAAERARLAPSARAWLAWAARREGAVYLEKWGELALAGGRRLVGRADRIEIAAPHHAVIVDVKTGAPPSDDVVKSGLAPQLPLEAAMLARSAFADTPRARAEELIYWRFGGAAPAPRSVKLDGAVAEAGEEALARLESLLAAYARPEQPFLSKPRVQFVREYADYDHLARRKEWGEAEGE
ncbi:MAG: PD-(D/E)XK nuclease family protein [Hyphomonadaceae bacterium]